MVLGDRMCPVDVLVGWISSNLQHDKRGHNRTVIPVPDPQPPVYR
jgi:hypothetical protein